MGMGMDLALVIYGYGDDHGHGYGYGYGFGYGCGHGMDMGLCMHMWRQAAAGGIFRSPTLQNSCTNDILEFLGKSTKILSP